VKYHHSVCISQYPCYIPCVSIFGQIDIVDYNGGYEFVIHLFDMHSTTIINAIPNTTISKNTHYDHWNFLHLYIALLGGIKLRKQVINWLIIDTHNTQILVINTNYGITMSGTSNSIAQVLGKLMDI